MHFHKRLLVVNVFLTILYHCLQYYSLSSGVFLCIRMSLLIVHWSWSSVLDSLIPGSVAST